MENLENYQINLEDNIELRKIVSRLEDMLSKKHAENENLIKIHQDFKSLHEKTRRECQELNQKLIQTYGDKSIMEKKYESEISRLKSNFEKQKEVYENQILKLSTLDEESLRNKLTAEISLQQKHLLRQKDLEIDSLGEQIFEWKKKFEIQNTEYETFRNDALREIEIIKENHKSEVKEFLYKIQLLNEKCETNVDKESQRNLRYELEAYRKNFNELQTEISNLRKEKDSLLMERNEIKINLLRELDNEKLKSKIISNENEKFSQNLKNNENEINNLKIKIDEKNEEIKNLINDKFILSKDLRTQESDIESNKNEIRINKQKISQLEKELEDNLNINHEKEKLNFINEKNEKEEYQNKIEELSNNLRDVQIDFKNFYEKSNEELHNAKRDFYILQEEKRNLIKRITEIQQDSELFRDDYEKVKKNLDYYEKEYNKLEGMYRELNSRESQSQKFKINFENEINKKNEEIEQYRNIIKVYEEDKISIADRIKKEFKVKLNDILEKKKYYKTQCVLYNQKLNHIIQKLKKSSKLEENLDYENMIDNMSVSES